MTERLLPALCWCESETVLCTSRQIIDGDVYCDRCKPKACALCAGDHDPVQCPLSVGYRRRPRRDKGRARPRQLAHAALAAPLIGDWNGWWTFALVIVVVVYIVPALLHLRDRNLADTPTDQTPQPRDVSTLRGWDEYVIGSRLERELGDLTDGETRP